MNHGIQKVVWQNKRVWAFICDDYEMITACWFVLWNVIVSNKLFIFQIAFNFIKRVQYKSLELDLQNSA